jgi:hypothetical protein
MPLPMYGPMIVVFAAGVAALAGRSSQKESARRYRAPAQARLGAAFALGVAAFWTSWQLVHPPDIEATIFGLGGDAAASARAIAATPETWLADRIYFSGRDERSFGVAYLPGLAYREMKWLDTQRALVWPAEGRRGLLVHADWEQSSLIDQCWSSDQRSHSIQPPAGTERVLHWVPETGQRRCATGGRRIASFGGFVELIDAEVLSDRQVRVAWRVLQRPSFRSQPILELQNQAGAVVASNVSDPYPAGSWETGEVVVALLAPPSTANDLQASVGFTRGSAAGRLSVDDPLALFGQVRLLIGG